MRRWDDLSFVERYQRVSDRVGHGVRRDGKVFVERCQRVSVSLGSDIGVSVFLRSKNIIYIGVALARGWRCQPCGLRLRLKQRDKMTK